MKKAIFVVGPTAAGKSHLAVQIAQKFNGSIINCDSIQFYSGLKIGSAIPSEPDMKLAPHYLYSYVNPPTEMTAGQFLRDFHQLITAQKNLKFPLIIVGGTGFYVQALEKGMFNVPQIDPELKQQIEDEIKEFGNEKAYQELIGFDPETKIHMNDAYRIGRALEVKRAFNLKMSELKDQAQDTKLQIPFPSIKIGLEIDKEQLKNHVAHRTRKMLQAGFVPEVQALMQQGLESWAPLDSVGYFEVKEFLKGNIPESELEDRINQATQRLIKKQKTWFKRDPETQWINPTNEAQVIELLCKIDLWLKK